MEYNQAKSRKDLLLAFKTLVSESETGRLGLKQFYKFYDCIDFKFTLDLAATVGDLNYIQPVFHHRSVCVSVHVFACAEKSCWAPAKERHGPRRPPPPLTSS